MKQQVAPLQANEVANIHKRSATFDVNQTKLREELRKIPPILYDCDDHYEHLDHVRIIILCNAKFLSRVGIIFNVNIDIV